MWKQGALQVFIYAFVTFGNSSYSIAFQGRLLLLNSDMDVQECDATKAQ